MLYGPGSGYDGGYGSGHHGASGEIHGVSPTYSHDISTVLAGMGSTAEGGTTIHAQVLWHVSVNTSGNAELRYTTTQGVTKTVGLQGNGAETVHVSDDRTNEPESSIFVELLDAASGAVLDSQQMTAGYATADVAMQTFIAPILAKTDPQSLFGKADSFVESAFGQFQPYMHAYADEAYQINPLRGRALHLADAQQRVDALKDGAKAAARQTMVLGFQQLSRDFNFAFEFDPRGDAVTNFNLAKDSLVHRIDYTLDHQTDYTQLHVFAGFSYDMTNMTEPIWTGQFDDLNQFDDMVDVFKDSITVDVGASLRFIVPRTGAFANVSAVATDVSRNSLDNAKVRLDLGFEDGTTFLFAEQNLGDDETTLSLFGAEWRF